MWLEEYEMAMTIKNINEMIMMRYLPMMMKGAARNWIQGLPTNIIHSWNDMRRIFIRNFEGTYRRPAIDKDIADCVQRKNESTRKYLAHWEELINLAVEVSEEFACREFICNCRYRELQEELQRQDPKLVMDLVTRATKYAKSNPTRDASDDKGKGKSQPNNNNKKQKHDNGISSLVTTVSKDSGKKQFKKGKSDYTREIAES
jgi:hypothetical protein